MNRPKAISFLKDLTESLENNNIQPDKIQLINDFILSYKFQSQSSHSEKDLLKYMSLGWYIHQELEKTSPPCSQ